MARSKEQVLFTAFIALVILGALFIAKDWPIRASIIILLLGGIGVILAALQLTMDFKASRAGAAQITRPTFEVQSIEHQGRWGSFEIWAWLWGLFFTIHLIGFPVALPLFVFLIRQAIRRRLDNLSTAHHTHLGISLRCLRLPAECALAQAVDCVSSGLIEPY